MADIKNIIVGGARVYTTGAVEDFDSTTGTQIDNGFLSNTEGTSTSPWPSFATGNANAGFSVADTGATGGIFGGYTGNGVAVTEVGFTSEGIDLSFEPEYSDVEVDQLLDSAILFKNSQRVSFGTTLTEASLENLARAIGQVDATGTTLAAQDGVVDSGSGPGSTRTLGIQGGSLGSFPQEKSLLAVANGPRNTAGVSERIFEAYRAISVESVGVAVKRNEVTAFPVSFRCLPEVNGGYMRIADRIY